MLVLRRKVGESIVLAGVINISVLAVEGERVKLGISAPPEVTIVREELLRPPTDSSNTDAPAPQE
ncbi:MAG: carbon storage regulator [Ktedonobacteraceae bacterium]|nr:carbon storage regulator [Ktedonobacteraceae bacterium]